MKNKHKLSTIVLIFLMSIIIIAILVSGLDIGDESECPEGYGVLTFGGKWVCLNLQDIITWHNITVINNKTFLNETIIEADYIWGDNVSGDVLSFVGGESRVSLGVGARSLENSCFAVGYNTQCSNIANGVIGSVSHNNATNSLMLGVSGGITSTAPNSVFIKAGVGDYEEINSPNDLVLYSAGGNIGIGNLRPSEDVEISGDLKIDNNAGTSNDVLILDSSNLTKTDEINSGVWNTAGYMLFGKGNKYGVAVYDGAVDLRDYKGFTYDDISFNVPIDTLIEESLDVEGETYLYDDFYTYGNNTFNKSLVVNQNITARNNIYTNRLYTEDSVEVGGTLYVEDIFTANDDIISYEDLFISGNVFAESYLIVDNYINTTNINIGGTANMIALNVNGDAYLEELEVNGDSILNYLEVSGVSEFGGPVDIYSDLFVEEEIYASSSIETASILISKGINVTDTSTTIGELYGKFICNNGTATIESRNLTFLTDRGCTQ